MIILIPTGTRDFDPTEVAVPWQMLYDAGHDICFATDSGRPGAADPRLLSGQGFGVLRPLFIARNAAQAAYRRLLGDRGFQAPIRFQDLRGGDFGALLLPGGHAKGMIPYLESTALRRVIAGFFAAGKPVGAICHGVVAACRAQDAASGKSVLFGRRTTALLQRQERLAHQLTRRRLGDYFCTYPVSVEAEVTACLRSGDDFVAGPLPILRDSPHHPARGFALRDGHYLSARWPGDAHRFGREFLEMLQDERG